MKTTASPTERVQIAFSRRAGADGAPGLGPGDDLAVLRLAADAEGQHGEEHVHQTTK